MPGIKDVPGNHVIRTYVPGQATAGTADTWPLLHANDKLTVTGVRWVPAAAVTGAATNNFALAVQNRGGSGSSTTAVTTTKTYDNAINSVAHDAEAFTLTSTTADLNLAVGDVLALIRTVNGTGLAMPDGLVEVDVQFRGV